MNFLSQTIGQIFYFSIWTSLLISNQLFADTYDYNLKKEKIDIELEILIAQWQAIDLLQTANLANLSNLLWCLDAHPDVKNVPIYNLMKMNVYNDIFSQETFCRERISTNISNIKVDYPQMLEHLMLAGDQYQTRNMDTLEVSNDLKINLNPDHSRLPFDETPQLSFEKLSSLGLESEAYTGKEAFSKAVVVKYDLTLSDFCHKEYLGSHAFARHIMAVEKMGFKKSEQMPDNDLFCSFFLQPEIARKIISEGISKGEFHPSLPLFLGHMAKLYYEWSIPERKNYRTSELKGYLGKLNRNPLLYLVERSQVDESELKEPVRKLHDNAMLEAEEMKKFNLIGGFRPVKKYVKKFNSNELSFDEKEELKEHLTPLLANSFALPFAGVILEKKLHNGPVGSNSSPEGHRQNMLIVEKYRSQMLDVVAKNILIWNTVKVGFSLAVAGACIVPAFRGMAVIGSLFASSFCLPAVFGAVNTYILTESLHRQSENLRKFLSSDPGNFYLGNADSLDLNNKMIIVAWAMMPIGIYGPTKAALEALKFPVPSSF